jgi:hypothetical protein
MAQMPDAVSSSINPADFCQITLSFRGDLTSVVLQPLQTGRHTPIASPGTALVPAAGVLAVRPLPAADGYLKRLENRIRNRVGSEWPWVPRESERGSLG